MGAGISAETVIIYQNLSDDGAVLLLEALKSNTTVSKLLLGRSQVGKKGVAMLAQALECNTTLSMKRPLLRSSVY
jgi:hypothetical protein